MVPIKPSQSECSHGKLLLPHMHSFQVQVQKTQDDVNITYFQSLLEKAH